MITHRRRAQGDQDQRVPGGDDARRRARVRTPRHRRVRRDRRRRRRQLQRRRLPAAGADHRAHRGRRLGAADGRQGQGAQGGGVRLPAPRPHAVHLPPPRRLPRRRQGADRRAVHRARLRDRADSTRWRAAAAGADERGRRAAGAADGRPLPRTPQRRPRRADGWRPGCAAGQGRGARRRQRRLELGVDRRRHGGRGGAVRQEPRPAALGRPDQQGPHRDAWHRTAARSSATSPTPTS